MNESPILWSVRYVLPAVLIFAGVVLLAVNPEEARRYFDVHGEWPEEEERPRGRKWTLPAGVYMDDEQRT